MQKLPVRFSEEDYGMIEIISHFTGSSVSDASRAAFKLGMEQLVDSNKANGPVATKGWIAALNGKVK